MTYDGAGNRTSMTATLPGAPSSYSGTTTYGYDTRNELTAETRTGSGAGNYSNGFSYDGAENPQVFRSQPATGANTFNADNQTMAFTNISGSSVGSFGYDGNGNPTTYKGSTLSFDPENRMRRGLSPARARRATPTAGTGRSGATAPTARAWNC